MEMKYWTVLFFSVMLGVVTLTHVDRHEANTAKHEVVQNTNHSNHNGLAERAPGSDSRLCSRPKPADVTRPWSGRNRFCGEDTLEELAHQKTSAKVLHEDEIVLNQAPPEEVKE